MWSDDNNVDKQIVIYLDELSSSSKQIYRTTFTARSPLYKVPFHYFNHKLFQNLAKLFFAPYLVKILKW